MKLSVKMTLFATIIIILAMIVCCFFILSFTKANTTDSIIAEGLSNFDNFTQEMLSSEPYENVVLDDSAKLSHALWSFQNCSGAFEYVLQKGGDTLFNNTGIDPQAVFINEGVDLTMYSGERHIFTSIDGRDYFIVTDDTVFYGEQYAISLVRDVTEAMSELSELMTKCVIACTIAAGIAAFMIVFLIWSSLRPVKKLVAGAEHFASGEYSSRIHIKEKNELGELASSFNNMADAIEQHINEIEATSEERKMLLSALSHEMKTPVTAITGYVYSLTRMKLSEEQKQDALFFIDGECRRLERLSSKLMQLISLNGAELLPQEISAVTLIDDLKPILQPIANEHIISLTFEADEKLLNIERDLMVCLITNLFDNARKAGAKNIHISLLDGILCVTDDGKGIPEAEIQKITQPFYVLDKSRNTEGLGLGLTLVRRIAELHKAELFIESKENKGTVIKIQL